MLNFSPYFSQTKRGLRPWLSSEGVKVAPFRGARPSHVETQCGHSTAKCQGRAPAFLIFHGRAGIGEGLNNFT